MGGRRPGGLLGAGRYRGRSGRRRRRRAVVADQVVVVVHRQPVRHALQMLLQARDRLSDQQEDDEATYEGTRMKAREAKGKAKGSVLQGDDAEYPDAELRGEQVDPGRLAAGLASLGEELAVPRD